MNNEVEDQDETMIELGTASTETLASVKPNAPEARRVGGARQTCAKP